MRRTSRAALLGAAAFLGAAALLCACGSSAPPLVFDSTTAPLPTTAPSVAVAGPTVAPLGSTPPATDAATTTAPGDGQTAAAVTLQPPTTVPTDDAPEVPSTPPPSTTLPPPADCNEPGCSGAQIVAYPSLFAVPQLGVDPVQGNGCGLADEFGNSVPDGLWFGLVSPDGGSMQFDVICAYYGASAEAKGASALEQGFFPVNTGTRQRAVTLSPDFVWRQGAPSADGSCTDTGPAGNADWSTAANDTAAWLVVSGGVATGAVAMCPT